jgi:hypothetical protein
VEFHRKNSMRKLGAWLQTITRSRLGETHRSRGKDRRRNHHS